MLEIVCKIFVLGMLFIPTLSFFLYSARRLSAQWKISRSFNAIPSRKKQKRIYFTDEFYESLVLVGISGFFVLVIIAVIVDYGNPWHWLDFGSTLEYNGLDAGVAE